MQDKIRKHQEAVLKRICKFNDKLSNKLALQDIEYYHNLHD